MMNEALQHLTSQPEMTFSFLTIPSLSPPRSRAVYPYHSPSKHGHANAHVHCRKSTGKGSYFHVGHIMCVTQCLLLWISLADKLSIPLPLSLIKMIRRQTTTLSTYMTSSPITSTRTMSPRPINSPTHSSNFPTTLWELLNSSSSKLLSSSRCSSSRWYNSRCSNCTRPNNSNWLQMQQRHNSKCHCLRDRGLRLRGILGHCP